MGMAAILRPVIEQFPRLAHLYRFYRDNGIGLPEPIRTPTGFLLAGPAAMQEGTFEPEETAIVSQILDDADVLLNVGANVGYYCCLALQKRKQVIALEPMPQNARLLMHNVRANGWDSDIELLPVAASDHRGILTIFGAGTGASLVRGWAGIHESYQTLVPCVTLDDVIGTRIEGRRTLIIMDIEGAELGALNGAKRLLTQRSRPTWLIEICIGEHQPTSRTVNPNLLATFELFWRAGYTSWTATRQPRKVEEPEVARIAEGGPDTLKTHNFVFSADSSFGQ